MPRPVVATPRLPVVAIGPLPPAFPEALVRLHVRHSPAVPAASHGASRTQRQPCPLLPRLLGPLAPSLLSAAAGPPRTTGPPARRSLPLSPPPFRDAHQSGAWDFRLFAYAPASADGAGRRPSPRWGEETRRARTELSGKSWLLPPRKPRTGRSGPPASVPSEAALSAKGAWRGEGSQSVSDWPREAGLPLSRGRLGLLGSRAARAVK